MPKQATQQTETAYRNAKSKDAPFRISDAKHILGGVLVTNRKSQ